MIQIVAEVRKYVIHLQVINLDNAWHTNATDLRWRSRIVINKVRIPSKRVISIVTRPPSEKADEANELIPASLTGQSVEQCDWADECEYTIRHKGSKLTNGRHFLSSG